MPPGLPGIPRPPIQNPGFLGRGVFAVGAGDGGGPRVRVFYDLRGGQATDIFAYDPGFRGGVRVALADLTGDGTPDLVTAPGPGMPPLIRVFDGRVTVTDLVVESPLGLAPRLYANLEARSLDLGLVTRTFSFGNITGKVDARIADLVLSNWRPVQFDARIESSPGDYPKRISQTAVSNISALADWRLAADERGETIDGLAASFARASALAVLHRTDSIESNDFLTTLAEALVLSGLAMAVAGRAGQKRSGSGARCRGPRE